MKLFNRLSIRTLVLSLIITIIAQVFIIQSNEKKANSIAELYKDTILHSISSLIDISRIPEAVFVAGGDSIDQSKFNAIANYINSLHPLDFFSYSPNQAVQFVYPHSKYNHFVGTNGFFKAEEALLSQVALSSNEILIYLYTDPTSNEKLMIIKNPIVHTAVNKSEEFKGFITTAYSINGIIPTLSLDEINLLGYTYKIELLEEESLNIITKSKSYTDIYSTKKEIDIEGSKWVFSLSIPFIKLCNPLLVLAIFLSLRCVYYMYVYTRQKKLTIKKQLNYELYVDSLTGVYNQKKLESLLSEKNAATLIYIALKGYSDFKEKEGSTFGDGLLIAYSKRVKYNVKGGMVIHLGEEEFVVFLEGSMSKEAINAVSKRILDLSKQPFSIMGKTAQISAKVGHSSMPEDSTKFTSLLSKALERSKT